MILPHIILISLLWANSHDVPAVLKERLGVIYTDQDTMRKDFVDALEKKKTFSPNEAKEVVALNNIIVMKIQAIDLEIAACEDLSQGSFCESADKDCTEAEKRLKRLHELHKMIGKKDDV